MLASLLLIGLIGVVWGIVAGRTKPPGGDIVQGDKRVTPDSAADSTPVKPNAESVGQTGFALEFDGDSSYVAIPTLINDEPGPVTLEAWVETNERQIKSRIIANFAGNGKRFCALCVSDKNWFANDPTLQGLPDTPWTSGLAHLAFVIDDREGRLFIDGKLVSRRPRTSELKVVEDKHAWLGASLFDGRLNYFFRGRIGELRVSKVARYEQDFTPAKRFDTDQNTLALYHFDEGSGEVLKDSSGHGHHGQIVGAKWVQTEAKRPPAADLSEILTSPNWEWTVPENLGPAVNTDGSEMSPHFCADGKRLWFQRTFNAPDDRAWIADREASGKTWNPAKSVGRAFEFAGPAADMFISRDEKTWLFVTWSSPNNFSQQVFESTRPSAIDQWSEPKLVAAASPPALFPVLSDDGRTLDITNSRNGDGLYALTRRTKTDAWSEPTRLPDPPNAANGFRSVWNSVDGRVLVFHSVRGTSGSATHYDLWLTTRSSTSEPWQQPISFGPTINTTANERGACLSDDGRELIFASDRPGGLGGSDLYVSRRVPKRNVLDVSAAPLKLELGAQLPTATKATGLKLGDLDAFLCNSDDQEDAIWLNDGRGMFQRSPQSFPPGSSNDVALADVDGDKDLDVVVSDWKGPVEIWINDGAGQFVSRKTIPRIGNTGVALGDLDGDGDADLVMTCIGGDNRVWLNDGQGQFTDSEQTLELDESTSVALGDLDRDGDLDLFLTGNHGNRVWFNDGHGRFQADEQRLGNGVCEAVELVDLDADLDLDAVTIAGGWNDSPRTVWLNNGQGRFQKGPSLSPNNSQSLTAGDLDGDGDADIIFGNLNLHQRPVEVWFNPSNQSTIP